MEADLDSEDLDLDSEEEDEDDTELDDSIADNIAFANNAKV